MDAAERRFASFVRSRVPLAEVGPGANAGAPAESGIGSAIHCDATLAPCRRNDRGLDEVTLDAVVVGGFMMLVEQTQRNQHQARAHAVICRQRMLDKELLDFAVDPGRLVERVAEADDGAAQIRLRCPGVSGRTVVVEFTVAPQSSAGEGAIVRYGRRGGDCRC